MAIDASVLVAKRGWVDRRRTRLWWCAGLAAYPIMMLAVWPSLDGSESFADLATDYPEALQALFGGTEAFETITTPPGFINTYVFSFMLPLLAMALAATAGAGLLAGEDEDGRLQLLLSQPVSRRTVVASKTAVVMGDVGLVVTLVVAVIAVGAPLVDLDVGLGGLTAAGLGSALYGVLHGALAVAIGATTGRRGTALGGAVSIAIGGYLLSSFAEIAEWLEPFRYLSPMYHATADNPVANGVPVANYAILAAAIVVVAGAALELFARHDLD